MDDLHTPLGSTWATAMRTYAFALRYAGLGICATEQTTRVCTTSTLSPRPTDSKCPTDNLSYKLSQQFLEHAKLKIVVLWDFSVRIR